MPQTELKYFAWPRRGWCWVFRNQKQTFHVTKSPDSFFILIFKELLASGEPSRALLLQLLDLRQICLVITATVILLRTCYRTPLVGHDLTGYPRNLSPYISSQHYCYHPDVAQFPQLQRAVIYCNPDHGKCAWYPHCLYSRRAFHILPPSWLALCVWRSPLLLF